MTYEKIEKKIDSLQDDKVQALKLIDFYIKKSKKEKNDQSLVYAYRYASNYNEIPKNFKYADSALLIAKKSEDIQLLTDAYLNKGTIYMYEEYYKIALDNILMANKYSMQLKDDYTINKTIYFIAQNKIYLGNYEDANSELKICLEYFKKNLKDKSSLGKNSQMYYLYSMMCYLDTNSKLGKNAENSALVKETIEYLKKNKLEKYIPYFISIEGTDAFYNNNYPLAISKLQKALNSYDDQWGHITEIYYIGLSNWKLGKQDVAVKYLEEIDKEYEKKRKISPEFRPAYELLIKYNDSIGNKDKQLEYINKLMLLDKSYIKNYTYLYSKINKEYDTQKLLQEKNRIERSLHRTTILTVLLLIIILIICIGGYKFYEVRKTYKVQFNDIFNGNFRKNKTPITVILEEPDIEDEPKVEEIEFYNKILSIKPNMVKKILTKLEKFEEENKFTDAQLSIKSLSEDFGTNYVYLSKIVNVYRGNNFNIYINDLRLEYAIELLKEKKYLYLDIKELAAISGFSTPNSFSSNFVRKFKMKPSYFIKLLKNKV
ncbi:helix-turn-helix domain-containing protein [Frigoriflavimonas asaccharolytica]|uniref:AraC-like DNA-binding protein n=1 Tax=Frigoriflavimonas asaccharolytica TaxID=2735899 RepID=A0A8J8K5Y8_9FLAO|nr:AraC family transcriptional regulator [Frigoriflavimonas asaccharolytica]NRS93165.1 AraC-like DNA-binding protein [Frigoriflavimonas asaccharolytica]